MVEYWQSYELGPLSNHPESQRIEIRFGITDISPFTDSDSNSDDSASEKSVGLRIFIIFVFLTVLGACYLGKDSLKAKFNSYFRITNIDAADLDEDRLFNSSDFGTTSTASLDEDLI